MPSPSTPSAGKPEPPRAGQHKRRRHGRQRGRCGNRQESIAGNPGRRGGGHVSLHTAARGVNAGIFLGVAVVILVGVAGVGQDCADR